MSLLVGQAPAIDSFDKLVSLTDVHGKRLPLHTSAALIDCADISWPNVFECGA